MKTITLRLDDELHKKLKIQVAKDETTMQDKLIELIKRYLDEKIKRGTRKVDKKLYRN